MSELPTPTIDMLKEEQKKLLDETGPLQFHIEYKKAELQQKNQRIVNLGQEITRLTNGDSNASA